MNRTIHRLCFVAVVSAGAFAAAQAPAPARADAADKPDPITALQGRPDVQGEEMLGGTFQNPLAGIAFRTPVNCVQVKSVGDEIARFANEKGGWELTATRSSSSQPMPLTGRAPESAPTTRENAALQRPLGLLEVIAARIKQSNPSAEIVRQDTVNIGQSHVGLIFARFTAGNQRRLLQQAIIQANDQLYYLLTMTSPAAKDAKGADGEDPGEKIAVESFRQMLDTVKLLDRGLVKDDQNDRLFRTRALLVNLTAKRVRDVLVPEQWMRLIHDSKDIGYTYVVEEPASEAGVEGVKIGVRSRSYPEPDTQVDGETWYIVSGDRQHENWSNLVWMQNLKTKKSDQITEFGSSDRRITRALDNKLALGDAKDPKQPPIRMSEVYSMEVQTLGQRANGEPLRQQLPPWYLPQAISHLLPRLLPLREPKTFMFAVYVSDQRKVMHRYIDVGTEQQVELGGKMLRAVPMSDRTGLEGSPTIHYISLEGKYLGSVNKESKITILPTDRATLQQLWANADLSRPRPPEMPKGSEGPKPDAPAPVERKLSR
jgi:hypothetical protein